jgi:glycosyltransferase involved in cell wall biosynthesis
VLKENLTSYPPATGCADCGSGNCLSAVIITFNEERNLPRCLDSLAGVADEVVVLDSFSTDGTEAICRSRGVRFFQHAFDGYGSQKNRALELAVHDYILALDADEALSEPLRLSIGQAKAAWSHDGYRMNRLTRYCGQWVRHGGWYPDRKLRLFDRRRGRWSADAVHEKVVMDAGARVAALEGDLLHYSYYSVDEHRERSRRYARAAALAQWQKGRRSQPLRSLFSPALTFLRIYLLKAGFLDGRAGWNVARVSALETHWRYRELERLSRSERPA